MAGNTVPTICSTGTGFVPKRSRTPVTVATMLPKIRAVADFVRSQAATEFSPIVLLGDRLNVFPES